eukprot:SAG31_NODE_43072_length_268_cov_1.609467_1_plen_55_part_10
MHDTNEDRMEHIRMVRDNDPRLGTMKRYVATRKAGHRKGKSNCGGRPRKKARRAG